MELKLIILENQSLIVSDEEGKLNDFVTDGNKIAQINVLTIDDPNKHLHKKIIAGHQDLPTIDYSDLDDEDCKKIGYVSVEKLAYGKFPLCLDGRDNTNLYDTNSIRRKDFITGFKTAQSLNDKRFSLEDVMKAMDMSYQSALNNSHLIKGLTKEEILKQLQQPKIFDIEVEMEGIYKEPKINMTLTFTGKTQPKITNNSIKITQIK